jgi:hypothetical protein
MFCNIGTNLETGNKRQDQHTCGVHFDKEKNRIKSL